MRTAVEIMSQNRGKKPLFYDSWFVVDEGGWIYAAAEDGDPLVKIGFTRASPRSRLLSLKTYWLMNLTMVGTVYVPQYVYKVEQTLHAMLASQRIEREWFYLSISQSILDALVKEAIGIVEHRLHVCSIYAQQHAQTLKVRR